MLKRNGVVVMKIENLKIFLTVAQTGNMHKTAEIFFTSYQNISFIIKNMEKELGFFLFSRDNKGMHLTPEGEGLFDIAEPFVREYNEYLMQQLAKEDTPVYHFYTTAVMEKYIRPLEEMLFSDYYYCSLKSANVSDMIDMLSNNMPGIYLIPGSKGISKTIMAQKDGIVLAEDKNIIVCHAANPVMNTLPLSTEEIRKLPTVCSGNYVSQTKKYTMLNIDDVTLCKKYMREKDFCYSTTRFIYQRDFTEPDEWAVLMETAQQQIEYDLIFNLPKQQLDMARHFFLTPLQELFSTLKDK